MKSILKNFHSARRIATIHITSQVLDSNNLRAKLLFADYPNLSIKIIKQSTQMMFKFGTREISEANHKRERGCGELRAIFGIISKSEEENLKILSRSARFEISNRVIYRYSING